MVGIDIPREDGALPVWQGVGGEVVGSLIRADGRAVDVDEVQVRVSE